ncbi:hypothetical protein HHI36_024002 [Cryptolaemus montrouzieri]|uniref:C2H2-type domain-containing protein n=1 Tax=Cryptolaemus montrouzieri TaxID=559131 RepID=A0ABD2NYC1_9CUCU
MLEVNNEYMTDHIEIINEFNKYFVGVGPAIIQTLEEENANREAPFGEIHNLSSLFLTVVDEYEIKKALSEVKAGTGAGYDGIKKSEVLTILSYAKSNLTNHINSVHLGIKNYKCSQCDYRAATRGRLETHTESTHLGLRNYKCSQCDYRAATKRKLKIHTESVHLGLKNHKCSHCDYASYHKSNFLKHINSVHLNTKSFQCNYCDYQGAAKFLLAKHVKNVHHKRLQM